MLLDIALAFAGPLVRSAPHGTNLPRDIRTNPLDEGIDTQKDGLSELESQVQIYRSLGGGGEP